MVARERGGATVLMFALLSRPAVEAEKGELEHGGALFFSI
jgi:hypothetical protein